MAELIKLRDGSTTLDPRLGRLKHFDERSRSFAYRAADPRLAAFTKVWEVADPLDQGQEGTCVPHACCHECNATPVPVFEPRTHEYARWWFHEAAIIDPWPGEAEGDGTSVLAGAQIGQREGYWTSYRWAFTLEEIKAAVSNEGPVVMGTDWRTGMYEPDMTGRLYVNGVPVGGHCWLIYGYVAAGGINPLTGFVTAIDIFLMQNSWGFTWGKGGRAYMATEDVSNLMSAQGECMVPMDRKDPTAPPLPPEPEPEAPDQNVSCWSKWWRMWRS